MELEEGLDTIKMDTNMNIKQLKEAVLDRIALIMHVYKVSDSQIQVKG